MVKLKRQLEAKDKLIAELQASNARPDLDVEIERLKTRNRNLRAELRASKEHFHDEIRKKGGMNFTARSAIAKVLHPDYEPTKAEREAAFKHFSQYTSSARKARR